MKVWRGPVSVPRHSSMDHEEPRLSLDLRSPGEGLASGRDRDVRAEETDEERDGLHGELHPGGGEVLLPGQQVGGCYAGLLLGQCGNKGQWLLSFSLLMSHCQVHSLVLAAACPVLQAAMEVMVPSDQDEMTVIIPDTNREDLIIFANSLYNLDKTTNHFSSLLHLINFDSRNNVVVDNGDQVEDSKDYFEEEHMDDSATDDCSFQYSSEDIKNLISTNPKRVQYEDAAGMGKHTKVWKSYKQIRVDKKPVPFLSCRICGEIFLQSSTSSSTAIKRHAKTHTEDRQDVGMKEAPGQKDGGGTDALKKHQLQQGVRKGWRELVGSILI